jgi:hypothetical protein
MLKCKSCKTFDIIVSTKCVSLQILRLVDAVAALQWVRQCYLPCWNYLLLYGGVSPALNAVSEVFTYVVCLKHSVNGTRKQKKHKIQTNELYWPSK